MIRTKARAVLISMAGAAVLPFAVACSSGPAAAEQSAGNHDAFMQCMTEHGVPAPPNGAPGGPPPQGVDGPPPREVGGPPPAGFDGPPPAPPGVDRQTWDSATQACRSLAPAPPSR